MPQNILFVDDDPRLLRSMVRTFARRFDVSTAPSGAEGLDLIREKGPFAVIVSDIKMPGMDGLEFLGAARELDPESVRMILTGYADLQNAIDAVNDGYVFRFLTKPCSEDALDAAVAAALEQYALQQARAEVRSITRLKEAMEGIVTGFVTLVEARDPYTAGHQRSVTHLSVAIAEDMGLDEDRIRGLRLAANVHDIGKVYVPAEFLNRPGRLTPEEFAIIKAHPRVGYDILAPVEFPWPIAKMVVQHHERLDGSGYPDGEAGEAILLESRIMAVADVVDAINAHRPYRPGRGVALAMQEIEARAGELYDERVVASCLRLIREERIALEYASGTGPSCEWLGDK